MITYVFFQVLEDKEEFFEMSTLAQLGHHSKPFGILKVNVISSAHTWNSFFGQKTPMNYWSLNLKWTKKYYKGFETQ